VSGVQAHCIFTVHYLLLELWWVLSYSSLYLMLFIKLFKKAMLSYKLIHDRRHGLLVTYRFVVCICVLPNSTRALIIPIYTNILNRFLTLVSAKKSQLHYFSSSTQKCTAHSAIYTAFHCKFYVCKTKLALIKSSFFK